MGGGGGGGGAQSYGENGLGGGGGQKRESELSESGTHLQSCCKKLSASWFSDSCSLMALNASMKLGFLSAFCNSDRPSPVRYFFIPFTGKQVLLYSLHRKTGTSLFPSQENGYFFIPFTGKQVLLYSLHRKTGTSLFPSQENRYSFIPFTGKLGCHTSTTN